MRQYQFLFLVGMFSFFLLLACSSRNPVVSTLHEWGSQNPEFNPNAPTVLYAFDVETCISCGTVGLKALIDKIRKLGLNANIFIVVSQDLPGESQMLKEKFPPSLIIEDTTAVLKKIFKVQSFPTMLIIAPDGTILRTIPDPVHHFPSDEELIQLLHPQTTLIRVEEGRKLHPATTKTVLYYTDAVFYLPEMNTSIILDESMNKVFSIDLSSDSLYALWEPHDSLRFHPLFRTQFPNSSEAAWQQFVEEYAQPYIKLLDVLAFQDSLLTLSAVIQTANEDEKGKISPNSFLASLTLRILSPRKAILRSVEPLPEPLQSYDKLLLFDGKLTALANTDSTIVGWIYRNGQWEELPFILPYDDSDPENLRSIQHPIHTIKQQHGTVIVSLKLPQPVRLYYDSLHRTIAWQPCCNALFWTDLYEKTLQKIIAENFGTIQSMIRDLGGMSDAPIMFKDNLQTFAVSDSTFAILAPFARIDTSSDINIGIDFLSLQRRLFFPVFSIENVKSNIPKCIALVAVTPTDFTLLIKWKRKGWRLFTFPHPLQQHIAIRNE